MSANDVSGVLADQSEVLLDTNGENHFNESHDEQWQERESRNALKHVSGLGEMQDVTEVEYRKVRLERVVLVGVWSSRETTQAQAEESLRRTCRACRNRRRRGMRRPAAASIEAGRSYIRWLAASPRTRRNRGARGSRHHRCGR